MSVLDAPLSRQALRRSSTTSQVSFSFWYFLLYSRKLRESKSILGLWEYFYNFPSSHIVMWSRSSLWFAQWTVL